MKRLLIFGGAIATLAAAPVSGQHGHSVPPATPAVPATPAMPAQPGVQPATPAEPATPAVPADPTIIQANPTGPGVPTAMPPNPATAAEPVRPAIPADASYHAGPYKGALTPPPPEAFNKAYPVCTRTRQDSCRNPGGK